MLGGGVRDEGNTQKNSGYDTTMDLDVENIDKTKIKHVGPSMRQLVNANL